MDDKTYWQNVHSHYKQQEWITKPTIFATQAIKYFPKTGQLLELGAGQAQDSIFFAQHGYAVTATDLSEVALKQAATRIPKELADKIVLKPVDLSVTLPFAVESFDIVYSHLAVHYFSEERTQALFDEIYTVLKPGGIFAVLTNTVDDPEISEQTEIGKDFYRTPEGIRKRYFSPETLGHYTTKFETILLDNKGETYKDTIKTLVRFIGRKS